MKRSSNVGIEFKNLDLTLKQCNVFNNSIIYIEKGTPKLADEISICLHLALPHKENFPDWQLVGFKKLKVVNFNVN